MMNRLSSPNIVIYIICKIINSIYFKTKKYLERARYLQKLPKFSHIGDEIILDSDIYISKPENISIGDGTYIGQGVTLNAADEISFGENCGIASGSYFMTWNHVIDQKVVELRSTGKESAPISVGDGAWVGYNAIILPGVKIGTGAVVGAGAVVTGDVPDWTVVVGVPASPIAVRSAEGLIEVSDVNEARSIVESD
jgi:acetyltransferase-like isoleucine patch superfamily enzyme